MGSPYLLRFEDGPLSKQAGQNGDFALECFSWPLPDRLGVLTHPGVANVAFWDADDPLEAGLPAEIIDSPNAIVFAKVSESQMPNDVPHLMRGAIYRLETPA